MLFLRREARLARGAVDHGSRRRRGVSETSPRDRHGRASPELPQLQRATSDRPRCIREKTFRVSHPVKRSLLLLTMMIASEAMAADRVVVVTATAGYRHDSIPTAEQVIAK